MVVLNEFTDAGLDALSVAEAARGQFDVRLVATGCLCCVGELEFNKQLRDILRNFKPARLLIEPSGAGHAAEIVDILAQYETQRALVLDSVICLVDALDAARISRSRAASEWSQIQSADVLLLSKPDLAGEAERQAFAEIAAAQYPAKGYVGSCLNGELPPESLRHFTRAAGFSLLRDLAAGAAGRDYIRHRRPGRQRNAGAAAGPVGDQLDIAARTRLLSDHHRTPAQLAVGRLPGTLPPESGAAHGAGTLVVDSKPWTWTLRRGQLIPARQPYRDGLQHGADRGIPGSLPNSAAGCSIRSLNPCPYAAPGVALGHPTVCRYGVAV